MYVEHFNLTSRPFSRVPSAASCVMFPSIKACYERACDGIQEGMGPVLVVGPSGSGKTMLLSLLENRFARELTVVTLNCAAIDSQQGLIQCLLFELGLPFESQSVGELRLKLIDHLKHEESCANGLIVMVDEAHNLPIEVLEELRMITNIVCGSQYPIRLVLAGGRPLEEKLAYRQLDSFNQRIGVRCYLQNMTRTESMFYILAQVQKCGRDGREIFQPSALEKIFDITDGVPRLVSQLSDHALRSAAQQQLSEIDSKLVRNAWADLQQLPQTSEITNLHTPDESIIEFGSLNESGSTSDSCQSKEPGANTLNSLMGHLQEWDRSTVAEVDASPEGFGGSKPTVPETEPGDFSDPDKQPSSPRQNLDVGVTEPIPIKEILSAKILFGSGQSDEGSNELNQDVSQPKVNSNFDQAATEAVPLREMKWISTMVSQEGDLGDTESVNPFPLNPSTLPGSGDSANTEVRSLSESLSSEDDEPTESVFGGAFEDESVVDLQTSLLAEQNRISSSISITDLEGISNAEVPEASASCGSENESKVDEIAWPTTPQEIIEKVEAALPDEGTSGGDLTHSSTDPQLAQTQPLPRFNFNEDDQANADSAQADDSDMLICETDKTVKPPAEKPVTGQATSTGQVIRMNYEDLFKQLRNNNPNNQT